MVRDEQFEFEPAGPGAFWLALLLCLLPVVIAFTIISLITPAHLLVVAGLGLVMALLIVPFVIASRRGGVELTSRGLTLRVPLYGRDVSYSALDLERAEIVDLGKGSPHRPVLRTNGFGLPGLLVGWCRLADRSKALVYRSRGGRAARIPTREDFDLLLEVAEPDRLLASLRRR